MSQKVVLVNGAGRGVGRLLAEAFARHGALVAANDLSPITLDWTVPLAQQGYSIRAYTEDVTRKIVAQALVKQVEDDWGRIDVLVHHAPIVPHTSLLDMDEWDWHRALDLNLTAAFLLIQSVGRIMRQQESGLILLVLSLNAQAAPASPAAHIAQMGLWGLATQAAQEFAPFRLRVEFLAEQTPLIPPLPTSPSSLVDHALALAGMR